MEDQTVKDLPDLYAAVCAKRPELVVEGLERYGTPDMPVEVWLHLGTLAEDDTAAALILARWVEMLPVGTHLSHDQSDDNDQVTWSVYVLQSDVCAFYPSPCKTTPLEALSAFWLQQ